MVRDGAVDVERAGGHGGPHVLGGTVLGREQDLVDIAAVIAVEQADAVHVRCPGEGDGVVDVQGERGVGRAQHPVDVKVGGMGQGGLWKTIEYKRAQASKLKVRICESTTGKMVSTTNLDIYIHKPQISGRQIGGKEPTRGKRGSKETNDCVKCCQIRIPVFINWASRFVRPTMARKAETTTETRMIESRQKSSGQSGYRSWYFNWGLLQRCSIFILETHLTCFILAP